MYQNNEIDADVASVEQKPLDAIQGLNGQARVDWFRKNLFSAVPMHPVVEEFLAYFGIDSPQLNFSLTVVVYSDGSRATILSERELFELKISMIEFSKDGLMQIDMARHGSRFSESSPTSIRWYPDGSCSEKWFDKYRMKIVKEVIY